MSEGETKGFVNGAPVEGFNLKIAQEPLALTADLRPYDLRTDRWEISGTITVENPEVYRALFAEGHTFTIEQQTDLNPHHWQPHGFRRHVKRLRAVVRWHWRKLIRKPLPHKMTVTIPDVRAENITITGPGSPA